jgi:Methyltransferase domain
MICAICHSGMEKIFQATLLSKFRVAYSRCGTCGFLCTERPYWLEEAYRSPINASDTGILLRNGKLARQTAVILFALYGHRGRFADFGGGYGLMTRMMRDIGFDFYWYDPRCENLFAKGFEFRRDDGKADLATCFEAFEHFSDPMAEIDKLLGIAGEILFSTELLPEPVPRPEDWWYYGLHHGQHVSFYSLKTLDYIASSHRLNLCSDGSGFHFLTTRRIPRGAFRFLLFMEKAGFSRIVRCLLRSRTMEDMERLAASAGGSV